MQTFLSVTASLLPLIAFWSLSAVAMPGAAIVSGFLLVAIVSSARLIIGTVRSLDLAILVILGGLGLAYAADGAVLTAYLAPASFVGLSLFSFASVWFGKPWTAEYSVTEYAEAACTPTFNHVNMMMSLLWGGVFLAYAASTALSLGAPAAIALGVFGAAASIIGPKLLIRRELGRMLKAEEGYQWPRPTLGQLRGNNECDVAVVGAGIGGLTAAALLADAGLKVVVAEQHDKPGGYCHSWTVHEEHNGAIRLFRFDAGVHDISGVRPGGVVTSVLERLGVADEIKWARLDQSYHIGGRVIDVPHEWQSYARELGRLFPASAAGIEAFFHDVRAIYDAQYATAEEHGGVPGVPRTVEAMLAFPKRYPLAAQWMHRPFADFLSAYVADSAARAVLCQLVGYLGDRLQALTVADMVPIYGYYFFGGFYPLGGSGRLAEALVEAVRRRGGTVLLDAPVRRILVEDGKAAGIELASGTQLAASAVISNADLKRTFLELVGTEHLPPHFRPRAERIEPACSAFTVDLAIDFIPDVKPVTMVAPGNGRAIGITVPTLVDPSSASGGYATLQIITLISHAETYGWLAGKDGLESYQKRKSELADQLIGTAETVIPDLRRHIVFRSVASPATFARYAWSSDGAIYGVEVKSRLRGSKSPLPGLLIAGSGIMGGGVEAVMIAGARAAEALVPDLLARSPSDCHRQAA